MRRRLCHHDRARLRVERLEDRSLPATLLPGFTELAVATSLSSPTAMEFAPDGKLFITEQGGTMEVWQNGVRLQANFFRDAPLTVDSAGERGLLGITFDPSYASNHFVYVYYTATTPAVHNRVSRFTANTTGDLALAGSERVLLDLDNLSAATNHNGGAVHFGPDGKLYVGVGENGNGSNAQSLGNLLGKLLRLNPDGSIPADNPFIGQTTGKNQAIWALGLRNPFTFAFQPGTGRLFINDVGQSAWEEIDEGVRGANYGWPTVEGPSSNPSFVEPIFAYPHTGTGVTGGAIAGGAFYNPATNTFGSDYAGDYFFADFVAGWIKRFDPATHVVSDFATNAGSPVDLRVGADGSLYYLSRGTGAVTRVVAIPSVTVLTYIAGLQLLLDGQSVATPLTITVPAGVTRRLEAPAAQTLNGRTYTFLKWSDGVTGRVRDIGTPAIDTTLAAVYQAPKIVRRR
jgi:glucose/arabinose dehydrogenase